MYRKRPAACRHRVSGALSLPSRGPFHLSFTVLCAIGHWVVFSLGGWSPLLPAGFHVSRGTPDTADRTISFAYGAITPCGRLSQNRSAISAHTLMQSLPRRARRAGLGSSPFARRYLGNRCFFLFLRVLRCFSSPGSLRIPMDSLYGGRSPSCRVSPFRDLRINGYLPLPAAYRSLSRLSSAPSARASALRPA